MVAAETAPGSVIVFELLGCEEVKSGEILVGNMEELDNQEFYNERHGPPLHWLPPSAAPSLKSPPRMPSAGSPRAAMDFVETLQASLNARAVPVRRGRELFRSSHIFHRPLRDGDPFGRAGADWECGQIKINLTHARAAAAIE